MAKFPILSKADRKKLTPGREPYWSRINTGEYIGYRKLINGEGTWITRWRDDEGKQLYQSLGGFEKYDQATKEADIWFDTNSKGINPRPVAVLEVCRDYIEHLRVFKGRSSAQDAEGRFDRLVFNVKFKDIQLNKLKATDVMHWLNDQVKGIDEDDLEDLRKAEDTANSNLTSLKDALNFAYKNQLMASDAGWKPVTRFPKVEKRREYFLTIEERRRLLNACKHDLKQLITALLLTAARPGEIINFRFFYSLDGPSACAC